MGLRVDGTPEGNTHTLNLCQACVVLVESDEQVQSILQVKLFYLYTYIRKLLAMCMSASSQVYKS